MSVENIAIDQAVHNTVHTAQGGAKWVAAEMNMSHQLLLNKVGLTNTTHHINLREVINLMRVTKDTRIIEAMANQFGGVFVPLPQAVVDVTPNIVGDVAQMSAEFGGLMREVAEDLSDGAISDNELQRVEDEAHKLRLALYRLLGDLRRLNDVQRTGAIVTTA